MTRAMLTALVRLWRVREVVQVLVARELKARYRGAALGFLWSFLNPLVFLSVYVLVFSVYMRIGMEDYPAFLICGLLPWMWFSASLAESSRTILDNRALVKRVALPSEIFPLVSIGSHLVHLLLSLPVLIVLLLALGVGLAWTALLLPAVLLVQFVLTFGIALVCASLAVRFRDLLQIVPSLLTLWFFVTPVFYPASLVPAEFRPLLALNPMAHLIEAYQDILFYQRVPDLGRLALLAAGALLVVAVGARIFDARRELLVEEI
jgi:lipopolysaccharide transport system permease protein